MFVERESGTTVRDIRASIKENPEGARGGAEGRWGLAGMPTWPSRIHGGG